MINKDEYVKWLTFLLDFYKDYHNHKETMAWVITALYVPGIITLGYIVSAGGRGSCAQGIITGLMVVIFCFVGIFVKMQFRMRWLASNVTFILMRRMTELNSGAELPLLEEWEIPDRDTKDLPKFVEDEIEKLNNKWRICKEALKSLKPCRRGEFYNRWKTEIASYFVIGIATIIAFLLIWY